MINVVVNILFFSLNDGGIQTVVVIATIAFLTTIYLRRWFHRNRRCIRTDVVNSEFCNPNNGLNTTVAEDTKFAVYNVGSYTMTVSNTFDDGCDETIVE